MIGDHPMQERLWLGARSGAAWQVAQALASRIDPNRPFRPDGLSIPTLPLAEAAAAGWTECAMLLLDAGALPDGRDPRRQTALMAACSRGMADCSALLCDRGASLDLRDAQGRSALALAVRAAGDGQGHADSDSDEKNEEERAVADAPELAARPDFQATVRLLCSRGASVDSIEADRGSTALHVACEQGNEWAVEALMARGADPDALDDDGRAPAARCSRGSPIRQLVARLRPAALAARERRILSESSAQGSSLEGSKRL